MADRISSGSYRSSLHIGSGLGDTVRVFLKWGKSLAFSRVIW
jgi:hypothetical protein